MINLIKNLVPDFSHFAEMEICFDGVIAGYQSVLIVNSGYPFAGGTHENLEVARRICAAEAIERAHVKLEREAAKFERDPFRLKTHPTSCGFAAGFEASPTIFRAVCEAVERWCWSRWIDDRGAPAPVRISPSSNLQKVFTSSFDEVFAFEGKIQISREGIPNFIPNELFFSAVIGRRGNGIFPGSRVSSGQDDRWTHALLEAWRHLSIFDNELRDASPSDIIDQRIKYFGANGARQLSSICELSQVPFGEVSIPFLKQVAFSEQYNVWRALPQNYQPWHLGDEKRFVY